MNCRDFDQVWNQLLDAEAGRRRDAGERPASGHDREASLREHAEACPPCRLRHAQFETLRAALRSWSARPLPAPADAAGAAGRILEAVADAPALPMPAPPRRLGRRTGLVALAGLAAAAACFYLMIARPEPVRPDAHAPAAVEGSLRTAVADARDASLRLARTASEPAARLGLAMLDASLAAGDGSTVGGGSPFIEPIPMFDPSAFRPALLDHVGDYAAAGARPLSDTARQAFGFLRSPRLATPEPPAVPPADPEGT
ncbi:hypothetical protein [Planctomyces sp. SH-PL62]|uniref:hypothetical protein n=1 Tax=Planctomyces sp. SH-PL62 TaxID=1636152 RepID=UPI0012E7DF6D|nr:hypothetical protein [Planctomyces sp. SH-PL62]